MEAVDLHNYHHCCKDGDESSPSEPADGVKFADTAAHRNSKGGYDGPDHSTGRVVRKCVDSYGDAENAGSCAEDVSGASISQPCQLHRIKGIFTQSQKDHHIILLAKPLPTQKPCQRLCGTLHADF